MGAIVDGPIRAAGDAARLIRGCTQGGPVDGLVVLGLDRRRLPAGVAVNQRHRAFATVKVWELVQLARELDATSLVLARFPRGKARQPSPYESRVFLDLAERAARAQLVLLDCLVMRSHQWWSLAERARALDSSRKF